MNSNHIARVVGATTLCAILLIACGGPLVMLPGGRLAGTVAATPTDWGFTDAVETIQIETRPADPYSVNVWGTASGSDLFIACGDPTSQWCANLHADPSARVRIGDAIYAGSVRLVEDEATRERALVAMKKKYDFEPSAEEQARAELFIFRGR